MPHVTPHHQFVSGRGCYHIDYWSAGLLWIIPGHAVCQAPQQPRGCGNPAAQKCAAGTKKLVKLDRVWLEQADAAALVEGQEVTLMDWGNALIKVSELQQQTLCRLSPLRHVKSKICSSAGDGHRQTMVCCCLRHCCCWS